MLIRNLSSVTRTMTSSRRKLWIFTDWDETITSRDTLSLIAPPDGSTGAPPFRSFGEYYMTLMNDFEKKFGPRNTLERQLEFLDQLKVVEKQSVKNVERRGLFKGVTREELCLRAKGVPFREGWKEFVETVQRSEHAKIVAVVSVNWSAVFTECALKQLHGEEFLKQIEIRANDLEMRDGKATGMLTKSDEEGICTGPDKLREMKKLVERRGGQNEDVVTVYIGDSNTDLPCLLYADIGIIIGDGKSVIDTCERVGVNVESGGVISVEGVQKVKDDRDLKLYHFGGWDSIIKSGLLD